MFRDGRHVAASPDLTAASKYAGITERYTVLRNPDEREVT